MIIGYTHVGYNELVVGVEDLPFQFGLVGGADLSKERQDEISLSLLTDLPEYGELVRDHHSSASW